MKQIQFLGAAGEVTGSSYLLTIDNHSILIDFGMFQGAGNFHQFNFTLPTFDGRNLTAVILTHAHFDHCGRLPLLKKIGFNGKIYTTPATKRITKIALLDSATVMSEDKREVPLYTGADVESIVSQIETVEYDEMIHIGEFTAVFRNAGHILGSASIEITDKTSQETIVFSGDLGNSPEDLVQPTEIITHADIVVMESTYGDSLHPAEEVLAVLQQEINTVESSSGTLLIPAFSIERTQEILHKIGHLKQSGKIMDATPVFLDSPMAIEVTEIYKEFSNLYNLEMKKESHPFDFPGLRLTRTVEESKSIFLVNQAKVIIAGSGMMSGGRIIHHLKKYIPQSATRVLVVGYQAIGTLGREIVDGAKQINIHSENIPVHATITELKSLSSHADQAKLITWLKQIQGVQTVYLVHGENRQRETLAEKIKATLGIQNVILPAKDQIYTLHTPGVY